MTRTVRLAVLLFIASLALAGGCAPFQDDTPRPSEYVLSAPAPTAPGLEAGHWPRPLTLERPAVAPGLDGSLIRIKRPGGELDHIAGARWAAPLPALLHDALRRSLAVHFGEPMPLATNSEAESSPHQLRVRVEAFHPVYAETSGEAAPAPPQLEVALVLRLVDTRSGQTVATASAEGREAATTNHVAAIVEGLGDLLGSTFNQAVERLEARIPPS